MEDFFNKKAFKSQQELRKVGCCSKLAAAFKGQDLHSAAYKKYSQNGEDGILYYIFQSIGVTNKKCLEICAGNGLECNCRNLIFNHGFSGLLFDGNLKNATFGKRRYKEYNVQFIHAWITRSNIRSLIEENNCNGPIDLLSLDIDGVDYWILKEIIADKFINPRVIVLEYQDIIGPERALTVPYSDDFDGTTDHWHGPNYCGASLPAFIKLLTNYYFIGSNAEGFNAFFIRKDIQSPLLKQVTNLREKVFSSPKVQFGMEQRWPRVKEKEWVEV